jgi:hypothetical protein
VDFPSWSTIGFGELGQLVMFPMASLTWLACQGVVHFVIGRYCNYKSNQLMGVNLTAPVVQLQVPFAIPSFAPADTVRHRQIGESAHRPFNRQHLRTDLRRQHAMTKVLHLIRAFCIAPCGS